MVDVTTIKELISPKTLSKFTFALVVLWSVLGGILFAAFLEFKISEPRYDFRCDGKGDTGNIDYIRGNCFHQYWIQNHKHGIPPYAFTLLNVALIPIFTGIYSLCVKSTVNKLERRHQDKQTDKETDKETKPRDKRRTLFMAYVCQLVVHVALEITFFTLIERDIFFPKNFPSNFSCTVKNLSVNCNTTKAVDKNVCITLAKIINGLFAFCAFVEIIWILSRARKRKKFMENRHFYFHHLEWNSQEVRQDQPEATPLTHNEASMPLGEPEHRASNSSNFTERRKNNEITMTSQHLPPVGRRKTLGSRLPKDAQAQKDFQSDISVQTLKKNWLPGTRHFQRPNPGEGHAYDLTMDEIYVHVAIHERRAHHYFEKDLDRREQLKEYPLDEKHCQFSKPEDILDKEHKNVLVVGRPGIGKTSFSTKMLRLWASGEAFNRDPLVFNVGFLVKFRHFNDNPQLSLRDLLTRAETVECLDDSVWDLVQNEPTKVLLIFDGLDEFSRKDDILAKEEYVNDVEEKMPVSVLYKKLAERELLHGASILTTTSPNTVEYVAELKFERTVEIRGFTSKNVEDYVEKFCRDCPGAKEKISEDIKSNTNLFWLCHIPVNCFIICHCLLQIFLSGSSTELPTKITDIYQMMVFFNYNRGEWSSNKLKKLKKTHMYEPFESFAEEMKELFNRLGNIALKGIEEGRLLFESSEVSGLEDCGLLHKLPNLQPKWAWNYRTKSLFCFTHKTVQQFLAVKHLADTECKTKGEIERFVRKHFNDGMWQLVPQFVAGLLKGSSSDIFIGLLPRATEKSERCILSEKKTLTYWPTTKEDKYLAVQVCKCLYEINDEQLPVLQNKIKFNAVEFRRCSLAPIDVAAVLHFLEIAEEVLDIDLAFNALGDLGAKRVKTFIVNRERKLKRLDLSLNYLTDDAAKDLGEALKQGNCKLESLNLRGNDLTDIAAEALGEALKHGNCKLESLDLRGNNLEEKGKQYLTDAGRQSNCNVFV